MSVFPSASWVFNIRCYQLWCCSLLIDPPVILFTEFSASFSGLIQFSFVGLVFTMSGRRFFQLGLSSFSIKSVKKGCFYFTVFSIFVRCDMWLKTDSSICIRFENFLHSGELFKFHSTYVGGCLKLSHLPTELAVFRMERQSTLQASCKGDFFHCHHNMVGDISLHDFCDANGKFSFKKNIFVV